MKEKKVLVIGSAVADVIINIDHLPGTAEDLHVQGQRVSLGGCACNVSDTIRHMGVSHTLFSPVGTGVYGDFVRKSLKERGIVSPIPSPGEENGCCYCMVDARGERTFLSYHGAEYRFRPEWFELLDMDAYSAVYICGLEIEEETGIHIVEFLEKHREAELYFAPGPRLTSIDARRMERLLALGPVVHLNGEEVCAFTGCREVSGAAKRLSERTGNTVVVTLGAEGALCAGKDGELRVPGRRARVKDTIGAGDAHAGVVIAMRCCGAGWKEALSAANRVAAAVVEASGAILDEAGWSRLREEARCLHIWENARND